MQRLKQSHRVIANALVWAAMMIAAALLMQGSENMQMLNLLMVLGWFSTDGLVRNAAESAPRRSCTS